MKIGNIFPYRVRVLKEVERRSYGPMIVVNVFLMGMIVWLGLMQRDSQIVWHWTVYLVMALAWQVWLRQLPETIGVALFFVTLSLCLLYGLSYSWGVWYLLMDGSDATSVIALLGIAGAMLYTIGIRAEETLATLMDGINSLIMLIMIPVAVWHQGASVAHVVPIAAVAALICGFLFYVIWKTVRERRLARHIAIKDAQREKLHSLGQLTGGVAHDFNNLLTVILGNLEMAGEMGPGPERETLMVEIESAAQQARGLTRQLLAFSRRSTLEPVRLDVVRTVTDIRRLLGRLLPVTHELQTSPLSEPPAILADRTMLQSVLVNLVVNARDAMPDGGVIRILVDAVDLGHLRSRIQPADLPPGRYARISVCDNGTGIPKEIRHRLFEPYFTTKAAGKGSGLGLSIALGFMQQSGGSLTFESREGKGTDIHLWFPAAS